MTKTLDLHDIQGNIVKGYGRYGFPKARYVFISILDAAKGRAFIKDLLPHITTAAPWNADSLPYQDDAKPLATLNIGFAFEGLKALQLPSRSLREFPAEFQMGMQARADILGDDLGSSPGQWDPIWLESHVHGWISINAFAKDEYDLSHIDNKYQWLLNKIAATQGGVVQLDGHRGPYGDIRPYQDASAVYANGKPGNKEHFGFADGIGNPYFEGNSQPITRLPGNGKINHDGTWSPYATGEFILGHVDEAQEYPKAPTPRLLSKNGTFMVYRKLHQNVTEFNDYVDTAAEHYPHSEALLKAKWAGRWPDNGAPVTLFETDEAKAALDKQMAELKKQVADTDADEQTRDGAAQALAMLRQKWTNFTFDDDAQGAKCPIGAHIRRANPRGSLELERDAFDRRGALTDRRRILRRGLPYGDSTNGSGDHGIVFMALNTSIERQFEFLQQQWMNYGNDFGQGNDKDLLIGNHATEHAKMVIPAEPNGQEPPFFCPNIPRFVETRGGEYFFIPSITALNMMAKGSIDPT
ncbi:Multifunctional dye peroxidase DyP2 [BD1-7 clade bacterium]|nr:Multifunctional dye peroxidase DyP2 [BD1-7 clade bacterium]